MTQPNTQANVVLSANVQPYQQSMQQAGSITMDVVKTVERLSLAIDGVFKKAGHRLEIFSAGSLAGIGAAVASLSQLDRGDVQDPGHHLPHRWRHQHPVT